MDVSRIAKLANLPISPSQATNLALSMQQVLELVSHIEKLETSGIEPTSQVTGLTNVTRADEIDTSRILSQESALSNSQNTRNGYFQVKAVFHDL